MSGPSDAIRSQAKLAGNPTGKHQPAARIVFAVASRGLVGSPPKRSSRPLATRLASKAPDNFAPLAAAATSHPPFRRPSAGRIRGRYAAGLDGDATVHPP